MTQQLLWVKSRQDGNGKARLYELSNSQVIRHRGGCVRVPDLAIRRPALALYVDGRGPIATGVRGVLSHVPSGATIATIFSIGLNTRWLMKLGWSSACATGNVDDSYQMRLHRSWLTVNAPDRPCRHSASARAQNCRQEKKISSSTEVTSTLCAPSYEKFVIKKKKNILKHKITSTLCASSCDPRRKYRTILRFLSLVCSLWTANNGRGRLVLVVGE
ncbi:hypothetical protein R3P38DRAFT_2789726 [Favolaschia claudopus]|uniref:Uncharacterized protein n=1 Tax=Favolaschia claudopus TaxID=2862362 RepID=A0AAW0AKM3_9AGAR